MGKKLKVDKEFTVGDLLKIRLHKKKSFIKLMMKLFFKIYFVDFIDLKIISLLKTQFFR